MKTVKWLKVFLSIIIIYSWFAFSFSFEANATSSWRAIIASKSYKGYNFLIYPQVSGLKSLTVQKKINTVLAQHIRKSYIGYVNLKKQMEEYKKEANCKENPTSCQYSYATRYQVKYNQNGKLSLLLYDEFYSGGAHGLSYVATYNFNLKTGKLYTISDILTSKTKFKKVTSFAKNYMVHHPEIFFSDASKTFKVAPSTQFYFTAKGINLIFQKYEVAPYAAGHPIIKIPTFIYK